MDLIVVRLLFVIFVALTCYLIQPFGLDPKLDAARANLEQIRGRK